MVLRLFFLGLILVATACSSPKSDRDAREYVSDQVYPDNTLPTQNTEKYQAFLDKYTRAGIPGMVMLVDSPKGFWAGSSGLANIASGIQLQKNAVFQIGSVSKTFLGAAFLRLEASGKLSTADLASSYLDSEIVKRVSNCDSVTIDQLLTHTSGIANYSSSSDVAYFLDQISDTTKRFTPLEILRKYVFDRDPTFSPGSDFRYSNTNYLLLGLILENVSGLTLQEALSDLVFEQVGLNHTSLYSGGSIPTGLAEGYLSFYQGTFENVTDLLDTGADGGILSSTLDVLDFAKSIFQEELLTAAQKTKMLNSGIEKTSGEWISRYGIGIMSDYRGEEVIHWHNGRALGYNYLFAYFPHKNTYIVWGMNADGPKLLDFPTNLELLAMNE
jgi:D-alanyl-D-alanine carboxypeptidase